MYVGGAAKGLLSLENPKGLLLLCVYEGLLIWSVFVELGIMVIRASGKFGCSGDTFGVCWLLWILMVYQPN